MCCDYSTKRRVSKRRIQRVRAERSGRAGAAVHSVRDGWAYFEQIARHTLACMHARTGWRCWRTALCCTMTQILLCNSCVMVGVVISVHATRRRCGRTWSCRPSVKLQYDRWCIRACKCQSCSRKHAHPTVHPYTCRNANMIFFARTSAALMFDREAAPARAPTGIHTCWFHQ